MNSPENNKELVNLNSMKVGQQGLVTAFSVDTPQGEKIQAVGLTPGEQLEVVRISPQGDVEIKIRGYFVSLPQDAAQHIKIKILS